MSPAMHASIGKIGLRPHIGGFATQEFERRVVAIENGALVDGGKSLRLDGSTLRAAGRLLGMEPQEPAVYTAVTPLDPDATLRVDPDSASFLGYWYWFITTALNALTADVDDVSTQQIWPEHFDLACDFGDAKAGQRANYGGSPGDATYPEPYLYVGPWDVEAVNAKRPDVFTEPWGAVLHFKDLLAADNDAAAALAFFRAGRDALES
jgi:hypothetical protein